MRYRARLAYDGAPFQGYQRQKAGTPTVQGAVEDALRRICGAHVTVYAAGRTDTGVHATGQVIAFDLTWKHGEAALYRALNGNLPPSVAVTRLQRAPASFHPRFDALRRTYVYTLVLAEYPKPLLRHTAWVVLKPLDVLAMQQAAALLPGERDFGALGKPPTGEVTVREIYQANLTATRQDDETWLRFQVTANAFLYRMVRRTVGLLYDVGRGRLTLDNVTDLLATAVLAKGVTVAPPHGLVLAKVTYPGDPAE